MRRVIFAVLVLVSLSATHAEEIVCRYCQQGAQQGMPLGLELDGKYHFAPDRLVDVLHIKIDVTPNFSRRTVTGTTSITASPIAKPVTLLRLDAKDIQVSEVRCDQAKVTDFVSTRDELQILLDHPITPGTEFTVHIDHHAEPVAGLYFRTPEMGYPSSDTHLWTQGETHESRYWFPCFDYPNERSSSEVVCHVPAEMTVLSNGTRMSEAKDGDGLKVVRWLQKQPHANYLICLVAGHLEKLQKQHRNVPLGFYTQPTLFEHAENSFRDTPDIMAFFEQEIGVNFPWPKYDQVTIRDFTAGGMENTTLTTLTHKTIFSDATENIRTTRRLDAHEMAHQWFGDYVTCKDWSHLWLNEGFATYYTHLYEGHKFGRDAMLYGLYLDATNKILTKKNDKKPIVYNRYKNSMEQFDYRSYPKGSWVLHMLRSQLGPDLYRKCIKAYLEKHALTSVVSDDLRQVIETHSGRPMDRFFDQWIYHARHPDLKISYKWMPKERLAKVTIKQTQKVDDNVVLYRFSTKLRFIVDGKTVDHEIEVRDTEEDFYVSLDGQPSVVRFDPDYTILADVTFDKPNKLLKAQIKNDSDMVGRLLACRLLGDRKTHESVAMLKKVLREDSFFGVRVSAARALANHGTDEAFEVLNRSWKNQDDARVRLAVVEKLANRYSPETPGLIAEVLRVETNPAIQAAAIKGLGRFHGDASKDQITKFLKSRSFGNELAVAAIAAIHHQNDASYKNSLLSTLQKDENLFSSRDFGQGLETLAHVSRLQDDKNDTRKFLVGYVNHPKSTLRVAAIGALGTLGDPKAIPVLETFSSSGNESSGSDRIELAANQSLKKLREFKPSAPKELIELREEMASLKKESTKVLSELKELRNQLKAKE